MVSEIQTKSRLRSVAVAWPPHDTEESILGTDLYQTTITNLRWGINEAAAVARRSPQEPRPWQALSQMALLGCVHPDGTEFRTYPDIFVYQRPINPRRGSLSLVVDGPPALI